MAKLNKGILGPLIGKLANIVGYERLGQPVIRMAPRKTKKKKPRTDAQKAVNLRFKLVKSFISLTTQFTNVGFRLVALGTTKIAENEAVSYNLKNAITGTFPDFKLDFAKVLLSKGELPPPDGATVTLQDNLLKFKWTVSPDLSYPLNRDQVMMLAYFPANHNVTCCLSGARRSAGEDDLQIWLQQQNKGKLKKDGVIETFIAFISDDRQSISNSVYVGQVIVT